MRGILGVTSVFFMLSTPINAGVYTSLAKETAKLFGLEIFTDAVISRVETAIKYNGLFDRNASCIVKNKSMLSTLYGLRIREKMIRDD